MSKRALIAKYLQDLRASYWFLPTNLAILAVILSQVTLSVDHHLEILPEAWRTTQVDGARAILALISQSMIGVAGVMFSITIVAVSFASGNFGPRLIGNFMRDRGNQWSLGILIATFVYTLLVLRAVQNEFGGDGTAFVPHVSMFVALGFTAVSVMSMIYFVHHIPEIINVSNISAELGKRLHAALSTQMSEQADQADIDHDSFPEADPECQIRLDASGYIQTWDKDRLVELATKHEMFISVEHIAGAFVSPKTPVLNVWSGTPLEDAEIAALRDCFALGSIPTEPQNPTFIIEQLVEMIARAMSPGVNDPFTAINCINWVYVGLSAAAEARSFGQYGRTGQVKHRVLDFETLLQASFGSMVPYIRDDRIVLEHLLATIDRLIAETDSTATLEILGKLRDESERLRGKAE